MSELDPEFLSWVERRITLAVWISGILGLMVGFGMGLFLGYMEWGC